MAQSLSLVSSTVWVLSLSKVHRKRGVLTLSASLLIGLAGLTIYVLVVIPAGWGWLILAFLNLSKIGGYWHHLLVLNGTLIFDEVDYNWLFNCLSVKIVIHYQSLSVRQEHQSNRIDLSPSQLRPSVRHNISLLAALRHLLRSHSTLLSSPICLLALVLLLWWSICLLLLILDLWLYLQT